MSSTFCFDASIGIENSDSLVYTGLGLNQGRGKLNADLNACFAWWFWAIFRGNRVYPMVSKPDRLSIIWWTQSWST